MGNDEIRLTGESARILRQWIANRSINNETGGVRFFGGALTVRAVDVRRVYNDIYGIKDPEPTRETLMFKVLEIMQVRYLIELRVYRAMERMMNREIDHFYANGLGVKDGTRFGDLTFNQFQELSRAYPLSLAQQRGVGAYYIQKFYEAIDTYEEWCDGKSSEGR